MTSLLGMRRQIHWMRLFARILATAWGTFWALFGLLSALGEELGLLNTVLHLLGPGLVFLASAFAAWRYEKVGGIILTIEGIVVAIIYPLIFHGLAISTIRFVLLTMALPPVISGALFLMDWKKFHFVISS